MSKLIAVTSGKGGVGKSTVSAGIARTLAAEGETVLLVDGDAGFRCLDLMLGVSEQTVFDWADVVSGRCTLGEAAVKSPLGPSVLAAPFAPSFGDEEAFGRLIGEAAADFDTVLVDFPAGLREAACRALPADTLFLTVATPDPLCVRDAAAICRALMPFAAHRRLIVNRFDKKRVKSGELCGIDDMIDRSATRLLGVVPEDAAAAGKLGAGLPLRRGPAVRAFARIADRLSGRDVPLVLK